MPATRHSSRSSTGTPPPRCSRTATITSLTLKRSTMSCSRASAGNVCARPVRSPPFRSSVRSRRVEAHHRRAAPAVLLDHLLDGERVGAGADDQRAPTAEAADQRREQDRTDDDDRAQREQRGVRQHRARPAGLRQHSEQEVADGNADAQGQQRAGEHDLQRLALAAAKQPEHRADRGRDQREGQSGNQHGTRRNAVRPQLDRHREQHRERRRTRRTAPCRRTMPPGSDDATG